MRGCCGNRVEDCSASCARNVTRCSDSLRISSEFVTSEESSDWPERSASRICRARASVSAFCARAAETWLLNSVSCWPTRLVLLLPTNRLDLARYSSTLASASDTLLRNFSSSPDSHWPAERAWSCLATCWNDRYFSAIRLARPWMAPCSLADSISQQFGT